MALKYTTTLQLNQILGMNQIIPSRDVGSTPIKENIGTGTGSVQTLYLDQVNIIANTLILYYGASESVATNELTETTHYTVDLSTGKIVLTSAGATLISTDDIFAEYEYNSLGFNDIYLSDVLERSEEQLDNMLNTTFTDGTATNPSYPSKQEIFSSQGLFNRNFIMNHLPLVDISTTLDGDILIDAVTLDVAAGTGAILPASGKILIGSEIISYTGVSTDTLTGLTRGVDSSTATAHSDTAEIHTTILEVSGTTEGTTPVFTTLSYGDEFYVDENGNVFIHEDTKIDNIPKDIPNRVKVRYYYGYDTIPKDITRLALILAKRELMQDNVSKSMISGRNEFKPEMYNADINEINRIVDSYRIYAMRNT